MTDHSNSMRIWDAALVKVTDVLHGLLKGQQRERTEENSVFLFVLGNAGQVLADTIPYLLQGAALFHVGRGRPLSINAHESEVEYYLVAYQADCPQLAGREMTRLFLQENPFEDCYAVRPSNARLLAGSFQKLCDAFHRASPINRLMVKQMLYAIMHTAFSERMSEKPFVPKVNVPEQARRYIEANYAQPNPIQKLSNLLDISRSSLHEQFRRNMGMSPREYLMQCRMEAVCRALCQSDLTIQEIAMLCGMRDKDYLSKLFSKRFGMAPGAYRTINADSSVTKHARKEDGFARGHNIAGAKESVLTIENAGRVHRYLATPRRVVCLNYLTAEMCVALGAGDRIVGVSSSEDALIDCDAAYQDTIVQAPFLNKSARNVPSFHSVCACDPDLVVGTSYSFQERSIADASEFERKGIHIYAMTATNMLGSTFEETYEDLYNLGRILGCEQRAHALIAAMREKERLLRNCVRNAPEPIRVFSLDSVMGDRAFTCGQSLENHMIQVAGGSNIFSQCARQFAAVDWSDVANANPQAILVHRFYDGDDGEKKVERLLNRPDLARTDAIRNGKIHVVGFKKVFPAIDNLDTAIQLSKWLGTWTGD